MKLKLLSYFMMMSLLIGSFAPFVTAEFTNPDAGGFTNSNYYGSVTNTYQSSRPTRSSFYEGSFDTYWPILTNLQSDSCEDVRSDFIIGIPPGGCSPTVVRSDLLAEQNVPVFCQLSAIKVNPLIDVSTIKSISFKGDYPDEVAGISFHPARAAVKSYRTLLGDPIDENIGYVVIVLKKQPDERNIEEYVSGILTASIRYDAKGAFGTGSAEYYLDTADNITDNSFWGGKGYLRAVDVDANEATIEVLTSKDDVYRTVTLEEGETSDRIYYPGQYCTAAMKLKLNKIDNSENMARLNIDGDTFWVREGSRLLGGKCTVRDLNVFPGESGSIDISCSGGSKVTLVLGDEGVVLNNGTSDDDNVNMGIGGRIMKNEEDYYLGYYGEQKSIGKFVVLFEDRLKEDRVSEITGIFDIVEFDTQKEMEESLDSFSGFKGKYEIVKIGESGYGIRVVSIGSKNDELAGYQGTYIPDYLKKSEDTVLSLIDRFPSEKRGVDDYWGEVDLIKQIDLAGRAKDEKMRLRLIDEFLKNYPGSSSVEHMRDLKLNLGRFDHSRSSANILVNNDDYNIRVEGFSLGNEAGDSVTVRFRGGTLQTLKRDGVYDGKFEEITDESKQKTTVPRLSVLDIDGNSARLRYVWKDGDRTDSATATVNVGDYATFGNDEIKVDSVQVREVAYVSLVPEIRNTKTEANFTFNIGIEKRAIELNPEKARQKIDRLNKSIEDWEDRLEKLGNVIKGMKGACLATSTVLTIKNMISGFSGEGFGRAKIMDSFEERCRNEYPGLDLHVCYSTHFEEDIEKSVSVYGDSVAAVNKRVKDCTEGSSSVKGGFFESKVVDNKAYVGELMNCGGGVAAGWSVDIDGTTITKDYLSDARDFQAVMLVDEACGRDSGSVACSVAKNEMEKVLRDNVDRINSKKLSDKSENDLGVPLTFTSNNDKSINVRAEVSTKNFGGIKSGDNVAGVEYNGRKYYAVLDDKGFATAVYDDRGEIEGGAGSSATDAINKAYKFILPSEGDSCKNRINNPFVRYYEEGNKQGFAAVVPIDKDDGWYVYVENDAYDASGIPRQFEICNVGKDMTMGEGSKSGDICQLFQASSAGSVSEFIPCRNLGASEVKSLYDKAENAIREANRNGNGINLDGEFVYKTSPLGPSSSDLECTDFMSVSDCNLMFNVCDPVICPTSRCDLGGRFPVSDVVASGVIGSVALCLPNFGSPSDGGVVIPVCLSGIHAGLDAYVSIMRSHKQCLEENVESGVYTGICDEITAVYTCEFFWGQFSPILDTLLERVVSGLYGGFQTRGGAEYLTISKAFETLDNSVEYFDSNYGKNAVNAFQLRSVEEVGGTVCKAFVGSSFPTSAEALSNFLEPESPSQFYAYFSENTFSDATVPSTSHYKVYYHIYAGNDQGVQYRVYLKNPPESSYYSTRQVLVVDSGYAPSGVAADEAIDFTAPSGYKELCVSINGRDECGFGSVTSDFGLNYASQAYIADQADDKNIDSTEDCITTSTSAWALASPNIQAGVEKSLGQDDIATSGIIRVCASDNPDKGVVGGNDVYCKPSNDNNPECDSGYSCVGIGGETSVDVGYCEDSNGNRQISQGKWIDVGHCDNENVRCWLDSSSVKENLDQYIAVNNITVNDIIRENADLVELKEQYKNVAEKIGDLKSEIDKLQDRKIGSLIDTSGILMSDVQEIVDGLDEVSGIGDNLGQGSNAAKAEALSLKASVYRLIVEKLLESPDNKGLVAKGSVENFEVNGAGDNDEVVYEYVYVVSQDNGKEISFVYDNGWRWSLDQDDWESVDGNDLGSLTIAVTNLIINLRSKDEEGVKEIEKFNDIRIDNIPSSSLA